MSDINAGMFGFLLAAVVFLIGLGLGRAAGRKTAERWIEDHCCYTCKEAFENDEDD